MEDAHSIVLKMEKHRNTSFFGVFDGHSGSGSAIWCSSKLPEYFDSLDSFTPEEITNRCLDADHDLIEMIYSYVDE